MGTVFATLKVYIFSVKLIIEKSETRGRLPYIFGAMLKQNHQYEMDHLHFHWGSKNSMGAEHVLNGVR